MSKPNELWWDNDDEGNAFPEVSLSVHESAKDDYTKYVPASALEAERAAKEEAQRECERLRGGLEEIKRLVPKHDVAFALPDGRAIWLQEYIDEILTPSPNEH